MNELIRRLDKLLEDVSSVIDNLEAAQSNVVTVKSCIDSFRAVELRLVSLLIIAVTERDEPGTMDKLLAKIQEEDDAVIAEAEKIVQAALDAEEEGEQ